MSESPVRQSANAGRDSVDHANTEHGKVEHRKAGHGTVDQGGTAPGVEYMGKASKRSRLLAATLRTFVRPLLAVWGRIPTLPWPFGLVDALAFWIPARRGTERGRVALEHCQAEWLRADGSGDERVLLHLHGGAFVVCGLRTHRRLVSMISAAAAAPVLHVAYRMLPAEPISTSVTDGISGYRYLLDQGYRPDQIVLTGDSAGGYLAFMVALEAKREGLPMPAGIAALSPLTDLDPTAKLAHPNAKTDSLFPANVLHAISLLSDKAHAKRIGSGGLRRKAKRGELDAVPDKQESPVGADLAGMPPVLIQVGSTELLLPDAELMTERLVEAGVPARLQVWDRQPHVFQAGADLTPEGKHGLREIGAFIRGLPGKNTRN